jgi:hypothetical protein
VTRQHAPPAQDFITAVTAGISAQHPLDTNRRAAIARLRIDRLDQHAQPRPRHNPIHLGQKRRRLIVLA